MNLLLDTHVLLWMASGDPRTPAEAQALLNDPAHALWFSVASIWEVTIKKALDRPDFQTDPAVLRAGLLRHGFAEVAIEGRHCLAVSELPLLHSDPFDRMLLAQAKTEALHLVTADRKLGAYEGPILSV